jgi:hypothetical protein
MLSVSSLTDRWLKLEGPFVAVYHRVEEAEQVLVLGRHIAGLPTIPSTAPVSVLTAAK